MFHCNGWCFTWARDSRGRDARLPAEGRPAARLAAARRGGRDAPVRRADGARDALRRRRPRDTLERPVLDDDGGAPPPPAVIERTRGARLRDQPRLRAHRDVRPDHDLRVEPRVGRARRRRAGAAEGAPGRQQRDADRVRVVDDEMRDVPADGETMGEIVMRGNNVMMGYFRDDAGDRRGVPRRLVPLRRPRRHASRRLPRDARPREGHHHLRRREHLDDRGRAGARPPSRRARGGRGRDRRTRSGASARRPSSRSGTGATLSAEELIAFSRETLPGFKAPSEIEFGELPKTSTGKVKKYELRERERGRHSS